MHINITQVENIQLGDVVVQDYPDFCDAYIESADWKSSGIPLTDKELESLHERYPDYASTHAFEHVLDYLGV